ncbi:hypothetical protein SeMB42_g06159 [Synchytrium endobioticum]|uniref:Ethylmalonyl-CoA decarboxylase n=1 Tax=Synchytrium endobioticum TaxID=286115 RepID=A0A507CJZ0_9FUNG|nr:hypothetical protein SeLEV6574_g06860 [Synchytrium endobioticum]TPX40082.1 hypothetical protein SeMB42_g06159 [Synchytrium endobioticum]
MKSITTLASIRPAFRCTASAYVYNQPRISRRASHTTASPSDAPHHPDLADIRARYRHQGHGTVVLERHSSPGIATIKLQNPKRRNALSPKMQSELADALDALEHEASDPKSNMCGVILMGDDHSFCSGFDLSQAAESFMTSKAGFEMATLMHSTLLRLKRLPMISVAAVDGFALGGGAELSTACDFRVVAKNASIRFVHLSMGVTTAFGGGTMLTNIVGRSTALRLLLSSPTLHAEEAFALGLCDQIAQDKQVYEESVRLLNTFLYENSGKGSMRHPVQVVRAMKKVVSMADELPARDSLEQERDLFQTLWGGEANMAAIRKSPVSKKKDAI